jgi:SAM-dependent methyltransferase
VRDTSGPGVEGGADVVALHSRFFNVMARAFPKLVDLHYGLTPPAEASGSLLGLGRRLTRGSTRLLDRVIEVGALASLPATARGLDLGCGLAGTSMTLHQRFGFEMTGLNINAEQLALARERLRQRGLHQRVSLRQGDARQLPFPDAAFDFVVAIEVAFHVKEKERLLVEARRVLKPGGLLLLVDEEWDEAIEVLDLMFYVEHGAYARLSRSAGLELEREVDLSADVARWMEDYARTAAAPLVVGAVIWTALRLQPRLAWEMLQGLRFFNRMVLRDVARRGALPAWVPPLGGVRLIREHIKQRLEQGRARHLIFVLRRQ